MTSHRPAILALLALCFTAAAGCAVDPGDTTEADPAASDPGITEAAISSQSGSQTETVSVSKCFTNATATAGGQMLIKAKSTSSGARLFARRPDGSLIGEVQNGGGSRYGGTVMPYQSYNPVTVIITSSTGGSVTVPTTPFQI